MDALEKDFLKALEAVRKSKRQTFGHSPGKRITLIPDDFAAATAAGDAITKRLDTATAVLNKFPKGPMGLTPEHIRTTPEYQAAKRKADQLFAELRAFNGVYVKKFAKEMREERRKRDARQQGK